MNEAEEDEFFPEIKDDDQMEEEEEEIIEDKVQHRRSRRLVLDDEEEEEEEEKEERRYATRRSENRNISGRRNRNLVSESSAVREAISLMNRNSRTSSRHRPQNMEEELCDDLTCTRCGYVFL